MALRVVVVAPWGERLGGAEEMLWLALTNLDRDRIEPAVVFLGPGEFEQEVGRLGIPTDVVTARRLRDPRETGAAIRRLATRFRRAGPDLVLNWSAKTQIYGAPAAVLAGLGRRVVWWQHQIPTGHWTERVATALPARAIGCSSEAGRVAQLNLLPRRAAFVVNPGIEMGSPPLDGGAAIRSELGIPAERKVVGMVGRLQPWKGQDRLLEALASLRSRGRDLHCLLVGGDAFERSPEYAGGLERLVEELGLSGAVTMTGQVPDSRPYLEAMDLAVNASDPEPFGIVLLEAMAAEVAVVAVGRGGPTDIVDPGVTGVLAESGEPAELARAIEASLADEAARRDMGMRGRERCERLFSAKAMADSLASSLERVAYE